MPFLWGEKVHYSVTSMPHVIFIYAIDLEKFILKLGEVAGSSYSLVAF